MTSTTNTLWTLLFTISAVHGCMIIWIQEMPKCGKPIIAPRFEANKPKATVLIYEGDDAVPHSWPWQVMVFVRAGRKSYPCGGSIIDNYHVLTAAHCVDKETQPADEFLQRIEVYAGLHGFSYEQTVKNGTQPGALKPSKIIMHEMWHRLHRLFDIAVLVFDKPIQFNKNVQPVCLPKNSPQTGTQCVVTGWGKTGDEDILGSKPLSLQQTTLSIQSPGNCAPYLRETESMQDFVNMSEKYPYLWHLLAKTKFCALKHGNPPSSSCNGDSGGGVVCKQPDGSWAVHGIVSHGAGPVRGYLDEMCWSDKVTVFFTKVHYFVDWIKKNTNQEAHKTR